MRKILFSAEKSVGSQSMETFYFIGILVIFAILASATVLYYGYLDDSRNKFKLILHCIMIITSVIPPELPMELSLAVTTSLAALGKCLVYCTEPQRIAVAGKVSVMCFDKTGTLTKDRMMLDGILCCQEAPLFTQETTTPPATTATSTTSNTSGFTALIEPISIRVKASLAARIVMSACHSLALQRGNNSMENFVGMHHALHCTALHCVFSVDVCISLFVICL